MRESDFKNYTLSSYDPVEITAPEQKATDEDADRELYRLANLHAAYQDIDPHPVGADDCIRINIQTFEDGTLLPGMTHDDVDLQLGLGAMPAGLEIGLLGHSEGETITVEYDAPGMGSIVEEKTTDTRLVSTIEILSLRAKIVPKITDEWVAGNVALAKTVDEARTRIIRRTVEKKRLNYAKTVSNDIAARLGERLVEPIPQETIDKVADQLKGEFKRFLADHEIEFDEYLESQNLDDKSFQAQLRHDAHNRVAQDIALMLYANKQGIEISNEDIDAAFGQPTPEKTHEARIQAEQRGTMAQMHDIALRKKAAAIATRQAVYKKPDGDIDRAFGKAVEEVLDKQERIDDFASSDPMKIKLGKTPLAQPQFADCPSCG
jgi:trigger factor